MHTFLRKLGKCRKLSRNNLAKIPISEKVKHIAFHGGWLKLDLFKNQIQPMKWREMPQMSVSVSSPQTSYRDSEPKRLTQSFVWDREDEVNLLQEWPRFFIPCPLIYALCNDFEVLRMKRWDLSPLPWDLGWSCDLFQLTWCSWRDRVPVLLKGQRPHQEEDCCLSRGRPQLAHSQSIPTSVVKPVWFNRATCLTFSWPQPHGWAQLRPENALRWPRDA